MKHEFNIKSNLPQRAQRKVLMLVLFSTMQKCLGLSLRTLRLSVARLIDHCAKIAFVTGLGFTLAIFSGCATTAKVTQQPVTTVTSQGLSVARLKDGRQGFVIWEHSSMDAASRGEFERAVAMMNEGKNDKAIELLTKVIERSPGVTAPYINIAEAYLRINKLEPAEQSLKIALGLVPNHPVASNEYGLLLRKGGRFKEAREIYEKALVSFPEYLPIHRNLGILCDLYLNDPECALKQFEIYSEGMPADGQVKIWIAELHTRLGR
jgi:tetratricopeptide (TPR) repeat protein